MVIKPNALLLLINSIRAVTVGTVPRALLPASPKEWEWCDFVHTAESPLDPGQPLPSA